MTIKFTLIVQMYNQQVYKKRMCTNNVSTRQSGLKTGDDLTIHPLKSNVSLKLENRSVGVKRVKTGLAN